MAQILSGGGELFNAAVYGRPNPTVYDFIDRHNQAVSQNIGEAARSFFNSTRDLYKRVTESDALRWAKAATRKVKSFWDPDGIYPITDVGRMQNAKPEMQRWIMAEPTIRKMYHDQLCEGYEGEYVDIHPGMIGEDHYDYRRVNNGIVRLHEKEGWNATTYMDDLLPDDVELELDDQVDILTTWQFVRAAAKRKEEDPTSKFNAEL